LIKPRSSFGGENKRKVKTPEKESYKPLQTASPKSFVERNTFIGLWAVFRDWLFIIGSVSISLTLDHWLAWLVCVWLIGVIQFSLAEAVLHEASHYNLFRSRRLHHYLQFLYAWPFLQTMSDYQVEHLNHHKHLMSDKDQTTADYKIYGLANRNPNVFFIWFIKPFTFFPTLHYLRHGNAALDRKSWLQLVLFWVPLVVICWSFGQMHNLLIYWIVPLLWVYPILNYWSEIEEHYNTRTGSRSNIGKVLNFFTHNEGYHSVHHRYPTIPFYNLPQAHIAFISPDDDISTGFIDTYRQIRSKYKKD
tara:strand:+ start:571 stop:1485 length:915 start_codon:yes stop_codon:yes gene_type:complete